jgi:hypothetical protein
MGHEPTNEVASKSWKQASVYSQKEHGVLGPTAIGTEFCQPGEEAADSPSESPERNMALILVLKPDC